jgi:hypothetical protein
MSHLLGGFRSNGTSTGYGLVRRAGVVGGDLYDPPDAFERGIW